MDVGFSTFLIMYVVFLGAFVAMAYLVVQIISTYRTMSSL